MGNCVGSGSHVDGEKVDGSVDRTGETAPSDSSKVLEQGIKVFEFGELKRATRNFRRDYAVLGEGSSSVVYQGWVDGETFAPSEAGVRMPIAVKRIDLHRSVIPDEWQGEVKFMGEISHPNVVKLFGYCSEDNQLLLVYESMQGGTLEDRLFRRGSEPLSWEIRMKIAVDVARGLTLLHSLEGCPINHGFETSSILLDKNFNAKLSGSGLATFTSTRVTTPMSPPIRLGTHEYAAPEYVATGHLSAKSHVYVFGVILSELLTGLRALDRNRPFGEWMLVEWVKPCLSNRRSLKKIMDSRLGDQYPLKAALKVSQLAFQCLGANPKSRPSMEEVLKTLVKIRDNNGKSQTGEP